MNFYYDVDNMDIRIEGRTWKPVEFLSNATNRERVKQHILKKDLTQRIGGKKYMTLLKENQEINGFKNKVDVINSIIDDLEIGGEQSKENAIDKLNQLKQVEMDATIAETLKNDHFGTKEESDIDTMLYLENEMTQGK